MLLVFLWVRKPTLWVLNLTDRKRSGVQEQLGYEEPCFQKLLRLGSFLMLYGDNAFGRKFCCWPTSGQRWLVALKHFLVSLTILNCFPLSIPSIPSIKDWSQTQVGCNLLVVGEFPSWWMLLSEHSLNEWGLWALPYRRWHSRVICSTALTVASWLEQIKVRGSFEEGIGDGAGSVL